MAMAADHNLMLDVIARWKRETDGIELRLRRDGRCFFWFPATGKWKAALEDQTTTIDLIEKWRRDKPNEDFHRIAW